jgi:hypothetical protein
MPTMRHATVTHSEESTHERTPCHVCGHLIVWLGTCHDTDLPFEPDPLPSKYDDGHGWAPGTFRVKSTLRMCFAPLALHPPAKRRRIANVMRLHTCRRAA